MIMDIDKHKKENTGHENIQQSLRYTDIQIGD